MFSCNVHCVKFVKIEPVFEKATKLRFKNKEIQTTRTVQHQLIGLL